MEPTPENIESFKHARWRVRFTAHLIALHEAQLRQGGGWPDEQQENERRHAEAKEQLKAFPEDWEQLYGGRTL